MSYGARVPHDVCVMLALETHLAPATLLLVRWRVLQQIEDLEDGAMLPHEQASAPFVEQHPLDDINEIFQSVHDGRLVRRAIMVPSA